MAQEIMLENVRIIFRNFAGEERQFNAEGDRNFTVILDEETGQRMLAEGWNVKRLRARGDDEDGDLSLKVKVSFKNRPPRLVMITMSKKTRTTLDEGTAMMMDWAEFDNVDLTLSPYTWNVNGKSGVTAYLKSMFGILHEDELDLKYAEYIEEGQFALPPGDDPSIVDGEILDEWDDEERKAIES